MILPLVVGTVYRRLNLHKVFGGQRYNGISTPSEHPVVLLFSGEQGEQYGYTDGFHDDGLFWYTGEGQLGDMEMKKGNLAIAEHARRGKELLLFEYVAIGMVKFLGPARYISHHTKLAPDREGNPRNALVFELLVDSPEAGVPDLTPETLPHISAALLNQPLEQLRDLAFAVSQKGDLPTTRKAVAYYRSQVVKAYVLRRAEGKCEGCDTPAPFLTPRHMPYLEPHHIRRRADKGPDHPQWVIALCPNCHKRVHYGADGREYNIELAERVAAIEESSLYGA